MMNWYRTRLIDVLHFFENNNLNVCKVHDELIDLKDFNHKEQ